MTHHVSSPGALPGPPPRRHVELVVEVPTFGEVVRTMAGGAAFLLVGTPLAAVAVYGCAHLLRVHRKK